MKVKTVFFFVFAVCGIFLTTPFLGAETESTRSPSAYFPPGQYEFVKILEGTEIRHDLVVQNKGTALLQVKDVGTA